MFHRTAIQICLFLITNIIAYEFAVSFNLNITFVGDSKNATKGSNLCYEYFGAPFDAEETLKRMDMIYSTVIVLSLQNSIKEIISPPSSILIDGCEIIRNRALTVTNFMVMVYNDSDDIFDDNGFFDTHSSLLLNQYFNGSVRMNNNGYYIDIIDNNVEPTPSYTKFAWLLAPCLIFMCVIFCLKKWYHRDYTVRKALVLIIGVGKFDDETMDLPAVVKDVRLLKHLWSEVYNYDVWSCNDQTSDATKEDVISFIDHHRTKVKDAYDAIIVHILSHSCSDAFLTSDMRLISHSLIKRKLMETSMEQNNAAILKLFWYHGCRDDGNFYSKSILQQTNNNNSTIISTSNMVTINQNIVNRRVADRLHFVQCIHDAFEQHERTDLQEAMVDIRDKLRQLTHGEEICEIRNSNLTYSSFIFLRNKRYAQNAKFNEGYEPIGRQDRYRSIQQIELEEGSNDEKKENPEEESKAIETVTKYRSIATDKIIEDIEDINDRNTNEQEVYVDDLRLSLTQVAALVEKHPDLIMSTLARDIVRKQKVDDGEDAETITNSSQSESASDPFESTSGDYSHRNSASHIID